jgi:hypothetical protein
MSKIVLIWIFFTQPPPPTKRKIMQCQIRAPRCLRNWTITANPSSRKCCTKNLHNLSWEMQQCSVLQEKYCGHLWTCLIRGMQRYNIQCECLCAWRRSFQEIQTLFFLTKCTLSLQMSTIWVCVTGSCSTGLDSVYWMPHSSSVWAVWHAPGPHPSSSLLITQPHYLGSLSLLDCHSMLHRIRRSALLWHSLQTHLICCTRYVPCTARWNTNSS